MLRNISVTLFRTLYFIMSKYPALTTYEIHKRLIWSYLLLISHVSIALQMGIAIFVNDKVSLYKDLSHSLLRKRYIISRIIFSIFYMYFLDKISVWIMCKKMIFL